MLIITMAMAATAVLTCSFAQSFEVFIVSYFLSGFSLFGYETQVYGYISEISGTRVGYAASCAIQSYFLEHSDDRVGGRADLLSLHERAAVLALFVSVHVRAARGIVAVHVPVLP